MISPTVTPTLRNTLFTTIPSQGAMLPELANLMSNAVFAVGSDTGLTGYSEGRTVFEYHPTNSNPEPTVSAALGGIDMDGASTNIYTDSGTSGFEDSWSTIVLSKTSTGAMQQMVLARFNDTAASGYGARVFSGALQIFRWDAGVFTLLTTGSSSTLVDGLYALDFGVVGSTLTASLSGPVNLNASVTDSTYTSGRNGIRTASGVGNALVNYTAAEIPPVITRTSYRTTSLNAEGWYDNGTEITAQNTGNSFTISTTGSYLGIKISCPIGVSGYIGASINGGPWEVHKATGGLQDRTLFSNAGNPSSVKTARVAVMGNDSSTDNWTTPLNAIEVREVLTEDGNAPLVPPSRGTPPVVLIGDSITRGRSLKAEFLRWGDSTKAWGWKLAEQLNKEAVFIAFSGQGAANGGAGNVPAAKTAINSYYNGVARPVDATVQTVFVAHGTNDGGASEVTLKADHTTLWQNVRTLYPNAKIWMILPLGYSANNETPSAIDRRDELNGFILSAFTTWADGNSGSIDLTGSVYGNSMLGPLAAGNPNPYTVGDQIHPNETTHQLMFADILAAIS